MAQIPQDSLAEDESVEERITEQANEAGDPTQPVSEISDYYDDTVDDYGAWSKEGYLHFGYWRRWLNPFSRKPMLEEMNRLVFGRLGLDELASGTVGDLGCGIGAVSR